MLKKTFCSTVLLLAQCAGNALADTRDLSPTFESDGRTVLNAGSWLNGAIRSAKSGDTLILPAGDYMLDETVSMDSAHYVTLKGAGDAEDGTVLNGQGTMRCVRISAAPGRLDGLRLVNGSISTNNTSTTPFTGGGVYIYGKSSQLAEMVNCTVADCTGEGSSKSVSGGGVYGQYAVISNTCIVRCSATSLDKTTSAASTQGGGIYLKGSSSRLVNSLIIACTNVNNCTHNAYQYCAGGGLYLTDGAVASNIVVKNCYALQMDTCAGGFGGGVMLNDGSIFDSLLEGNQATSCGGGAAIYKGIVDGCSVVSNNIAASGSSWTYFGGGIGMSQAAGSSQKTIRRTRFDGNWCNGVKPNGEASVIGRGNALGVYNCTKVAVPIVLESCLFGDNRLTNTTAAVDARACIAVQKSQGIRFTGCVFSGQRGYDPVFYIEESSSNRLERCAFVDNGVCAVSHKAPQSTVECLSVDGCLFKSNGTADTSCFYTQNTKSAYQATIHLRQCTFVDNPRSPVIQFSYAHSVRDLSAAGCVFYGNGSGGTGSFGASDSAHPSNVFNSFIPLQSSVDESCRTSHGNLFGEIISMPGFLKAAEGDYRLRGSSPLVNSGGAAEEWMGSGVLPEKGGVGDLGDGTWTADATATFTIRGVEYSVGANVAFNDVHPRLYGLPDMGCFEYFPESGQWIIFR